MIFSKGSKVVYVSLSKADKFKNTISKYLKEHSISHVGTDGAKLELKEGDYYDYLVKLLTEISRDKKRLVILIDEFAQTVENISKKSEASDATKFLDLNRTKTKPGIKPECNFHIRRLYRA